MNNSWARYRCVASSRSNSSTYNDASLRTSVRSTPRFERGEHDPRDYPHRLPDRLDYSDATLPGGAAGRFEGLARPRVRSSPLTLTALAARSRHSCERTQFSPMAGGFRSRRCARDSFDANASGFAIFLHSVDQKPPRWTATRHDTPSASTSKTGSTTRLSCFSPRRSRVSYFDNFSIDPSHLRPGPFFVTRILRIETQEPHTTSKSYSFRIAASTFQSDGAVRHATSGTSSSSIFRRSSTT